MLTYKSNRIIIVLKYLLKRKTKKWKSAVWIVKKLYCSICEGKIYYAEFLNKDWETIHSFRIRSCNSPGTGGDSVVESDRYSDVRASSWWYGLPNRIKISVNMICAKYQFSGIDCHTLLAQFIEVKIKEVLKLII